MNTKQSILLLTLIVLGSLVLVQITRAQINEYSQITNQSCDAVTPCPSGLECYSFPNIGLKCAQPNPCAYFKCPSDKSNCSYLESYPAQLICKCEGLECSSQKGGEIPISYDTKTQQTTIHVITPNNQTASRNISIKTVSGNTGVSQGTLKTVDASVSAEYSGKLVIENSQLFMETSAGRKRINVLPENAIGISETPNKETFQKIELKEELQQPVYFIKGIKQTKLFFIIPVLRRIETKVSAESGDILSVKKPWWSFLVW